jgi:hypothetical protein
MFTEEITYSNDIKIVKEISTYEDDPFYTECHYNKDGFWFYYKYSNPSTSEFWFKGPNWTSTINYDPNREAKLIVKHNKIISVFDKSKCAFVVNNTQFIKADVISMIENIK